MSSPFAPMSTPIVNHREGCEGTQEISECSLRKPLTLAISSPSPISEAHLRDLFNGLSSAAESETATSPISPGSQIYHEKERIANVEVSVVNPYRPERLKCRLASAFFALFILGWGDGVTGTLLPHFQQDFNLSFMISSLFFVASATGFALGTALVEHVTRFLGRYYLTSTTRHALLSFPSIRQLLTGKTYSCEEKNEEPILGRSVTQSRILVLAIASLLHASFFVIMGSKRGFASMFVAYVISAFARSFITAALNHYVSSTPKKTMGYMYACWAFGAFFAPLVCQSVIDTGIRWANFYFGSLVLSAINTTLIIYAFRPTPTEVQFEAALDLELSKSTSRSSAVPSDSQKLHTDVDPATMHNVTVSMELSAPSGSLLAAIKKPYMWTFSLFAWLYTGSESSTQGFIVLYLLGTRNANPNTVGYVTSGFWGGMAVSRMIWGYMGPLVSFTQRKYIIHVCIFVALIMHILIWVVRSYIENAFSTAIIGFVYGPIFPGNLSMANDVLPLQLHLVSMAVISACASVGAALFPFLTGTISNAKGPHILPYITVAQTGTMFCLWCFFPSKRPQK